MRLKETRSRSWWRPFQGLLLASGVATLAWRRGLLSRSGALSAIPIGASAWSAGGLRWSLPLLAFFLSSSLLSLLPKGKQSRRIRPSRKASQVWANGGVAAALATASAFHPRFPLRVAFLGSLAAVNGDTWASEGGRLAGAEPVLLANGKRVPVGTPGAVSWPGTLAALAGAAFVGKLGTLSLGTPKAERVPLILATSLGGFLATLVDSLLGATAQGVYFCPACQEEGEEPVHSCGHQTQLIRGQRLVTNDTVNLACSLTGAIATLALYAVFSPRRRSPGGQ